MPAFLALDRVGLRTPDRTPLFDDLDLSIGAESVGLVGRNGSGKSTLLNVIAGGQPPASGTIRTDGRVGMLAQEWAPNLSASSALGVAAGLSVLSRISSGDGASEDFDAADWSLEQRVDAALTKTGLDGIDLDRPMGSFSGGERTRIGIARLLLEEPDVLLLDEPTNNLDGAGRDAILSLIENWQGGVLVASHDRDLLNKMDRIVELNPVNIRIVSGGWDQFAAHREAERNRAAADLERSSSVVRQTEQAAQRERERQARRDKAGRASAKTGSQPAILLGKQAERAENSGANQGRIAKQKIEAAQGQLNEARAKIEVIKPIIIDLPKSGIVPSADILTMDGVTVRLGDREFGPWSIKVRGAERVAVCGLNGSGKTTFLKAAAALLPSQKADEHSVTQRLTILDQHIGMLDREASILENFRRLNPAMSQEQTYAACAHFAFRNRDTEQLVGTLSGGERLRAGLACTLAGECPPWLLILDEPTNHLDIETIELLEQALSTFDGALMVVSHDERFLDTIGITRRFDVSV